MNNSILDLILTTVDSTQCSRANYVLREKVDVHHLPFECVMSVHVSSIQRTHKKSYDFFKCDYDAIVSCLNTYDWTRLLTGDDINVIVNDFYKILYTVIETFVPKTAGNEDSFPPWFNSTLKRKTLEQKCVHSDYKKTHSDHDRKMFTNLRAAY